VDIPSEDTTDQELADLMSDPEETEQIGSIEDGSGSSVEVGIPPPLNDDGTEVDSSEESFSINDFEEDFHPDNPDNSEIQKEELGEREVQDDASGNLSEIEEIKSIPIDKTPVPVSTQNGGGEVAQFRQTLASLSRQLELDRLAFLHKSLEDSGEKLPSLNEIASDISGKKLITPTGDCDLYCKRPTARLDGWISGLSFGVNRRAKKFSS
jgi:hypothetical protein